MASNLSLSPIEKELQYSLIYEEYKGNFATARNKLEAKNKEGSGLALGLLKTLQGNVSEALQLFQNLEDQAEQNDPKRIRLRYLYWLAQSWQYNTFPDGNGAGALEINARWNPQNVLAGLQAEVNQLSATIDSNTWKLEQLLIFSFLPGLQSARSLVQNTVNNASGLSPETMLNAALSQYSSFLQEAQNFGLTPSLTAYAHLTAADLCHRAGNHQQKQSLLEQAAVSYYQAQDRTGQARCLLMQGDWYAAPFSSPLALNLSISDAYSEGSQLDWRLEARENSMENADLKEATRYYQEALKIYEAVEAPRGIGHVQLRIGYLFWQEEDYGTALEWIKKAEKAFRVAEDYPALYLAQTHRMLAEVSNGKLAPDLNTAHSIGEWGKRSGSFSYTLGLGLLIGRVARHWLIRKVDYEKALACYRLAQQLYTGLGALFNQAQSIVDQGRTYELIGEFTSALNTYEKAADLFGQTIQSRQVITNDLQRIAIMLVQSYYNLAIKNMDGKAIASCIEKLDRIQLASSHAISEFDQAHNQVMDFAITGLADSIKSQAKVFAPLYQAIAARNKGATAKAEMLFAKAAQEAEITPGGAFLKASVLAQQRKYAEAKDLFETYLANSGAGQGFSQELLQLLASAGGEQASQQMAQQQIRLNEQAFTFMVRTKHFEDAQDYARRLESLGGANWWQNQSQAWLTLSDYGEMYEGLGGLVEKDGNKESALQLWSTSLNYFEKGIEVLEAQRNRLSRDELKTALGGGLGVQFLYFCATRICVKMYEAYKQLDDPEEAQRYLAKSFSLAEKNKSKALLDLMEDSQSLRRVSVDESAVFRQWREITARLSLYRRRMAYERRKSQPEPDHLVQIEQWIEQAENRLQEVQVKLEKENPILLNLLKEEAAITSLEKVPSLLPHSSTLLQYFFLDQTLLIWAVNTHGVSKVYQIEQDAKALAREAISFHNACQHQQPWEERSKALAQKLLRPLRESPFKQCKRIFIVPHAELHLIPFAALMLEGNLLVENYELAHLPSASSLLYLQRKNTSGWKNEKVLSIGNPVNMRFQPPLGEEVSFSTLEGASLEAAYIAQLTHGKALLGEAATRKKVMEQVGQFPILHFSTHGYLSEHFPFQSALLLANGEALSVYDFIGLQLHTRLVVLSACQTALGERTGGDDLLGLTRGLLGAGAEAAVVTSWSVSDASTTLLMSVFYQALQRPDVTPSQALRNAQLMLKTMSKAEGLKQFNVLREAVDPEIEIAFSEAEKGVGKQKKQETSVDYSHPYYWSAFVFIGSSG